MRHLLFSKPQLPQRLSDGQDMIVAPPMLGERLLLPIGGTGPLPNFVVSAAA